MNRTITLLGALLAGLSLVRQATAATATLTADASTLSTSSNSNLGSKTTLVVKGPPAVTSVANAYVQFDLSTLPTGTTGSDVAKATLTLGVNSVPKAGSFDVFRVTSAWTEATINAVAAPTLNGSPEVSAVPLAVTDKGDFKTIDVTQLVKDWLDNVLPNNGIALVPNAAGVSAVFDSKESTTTSHEPQLDIELGAVTNFKGSLSGDVTGTQTATHVGKINGASLGALGSATSGQALTFNGSNWIPSSVVSSVTASAPLASSGGQSPNVSLTGTVPVSNGGTGAGTASAALSNLGAAANGSNSDITSLSGIIGNIDLPASTATAGNITKGGARFMHNFGIQNTFVGDLAGNLSMTGYSNTGFGKGTLLANTTGNQNTAVGIAAQSANTTGSDNSAVGAFALQDNTTGNGNAALGYTALLFNTTGGFNTAVGDAALHLNADGGSNTAVGHGALHENSNGLNNTALGDSALLLNSSGSDNVALGKQALQSNTGSENIAVGTGAGFSLTTGTSNIDIGNQGVAAESNTIRVGSSGTHSKTFIAGIGGTTISGGAVVFVDSNGQLGTATGSSSVALGDTALEVNTGANNTAVGGFSLRFNTTGFSNTVIGAQALTLNTTGTYNNAVGAGALASNTTGGRNEAMGVGALSSLHTGSNNIALGFNAGVNFNGAESDNIDIGDQGVAAESSTIRIGTAGTQTATYIAGINGATSSSGVAVFVNASGQLGTTTSSARFKDDIQNMGDRTNALMKLRPVRFRYKKDIDPSGLEQYGLVAEEVAKVYPDLVVYDDQGQPQTVRYHFVNAMLLNEVQKQARQLTAQHRRLTEQTLRMKEQARQIGALTTRLVQIETVLGAQQHAPAIEARYSGTTGSISH